MNDAFLFGFFFALKCLASNWGTSGTERSGNLLMEPGVMSGKLKLLLFISLSLSLVPSSLLISFAIQRVTFGLLLLRSGNRKGENE
jgi:hypothetical protein